MLLYILQLRLYALQYKCKYYTRENPKEWNYGKEKY